MSNNNSFQGRKIGMPAEPDTAPSMTGGRRRLKHHSKKHHSKKHHTKKHHSKKHHSKKHHSKKHHSKKHHSKKHRSRKRRGGNPVWAVPAVLLAAQKLVQRNGFGF